MASNQTEQSARDTKQLLEDIRHRETSSSHILLAFVLTGLAFMLLPGTFLGVWNLLRITSHRAVASLPDYWIQAHGQAQVFGWVGSFILGIGFYSIPKTGGTRTSLIRREWTCWALWTVGITLRWWTTAYLTEWKILLPLSAIAQLAAFLIFFQMVSSHRAAGPERKPLDPWIWVVSAATLGFLISLLVNLAEAISLARAGVSPAFPHVFDQRYLALITWGMLVPFVWGFSAKWMPIFLGIGKSRIGALLTAVGINFAGIAVVFAGWTQVAMFILLAGAALSVYALRMFEFPLHEPKTKGVHSSFPVFVRIAHLWLITSALLELYAAYYDHSGGVWGASRHALTVGFIAVTVFCVGQRVLPSFAGMAVLFSTRLMFLGLLLLNVGCLLRVSSEFLAYQGHAEWAWQVLPISALIELTAVTVFAINLIATFALRRQTIIQPDRVTISL